MLDVQTFLKRRTKLYHFTSGNKWPLIKEHGLFCTTDLLKGAAFSSQVNHEKVAAIRRNRELTVDVPGIGSVVIRDQKPLLEKGLSTALQGCMSNQQWIDLLNDRVFFWTNRTHAERLKIAYGNRASQARFWNWTPAQLYRATPSESDWQPSIPGIRLAKRSRVAKTAFTSFLHMKELFPRSRN